MKIAIGLKKILGEAIDQGLRRRVGDEMFRQFEGEMACGFRAAGEGEQGRLRLILSSLRIIAAEQFLRAGLMDIGLEHERAGRSQQAFAAGETPAGEHVGQRDHVALAIAAIDAERVQFEDFAAEVFVAAAMLPQAGGRVGPMLCWLSR